MHIICASNHSGAKCPTRSKTGVHQEGEREGGEGLVAHGAQVRPSPAGSHSPTPEGGGGGQREDKASTPASPPGGGAKRGQGEHACIPTQEGQLCIKPRRTRRGRGRRGGRGERWVGFGVG